MSMTKKRILLFVVITSILVMLCTGVLHADGSSSGGSCIVSWWQWPSPPIPGFKWTIRGQFYAYQLTDGGCRTIVNKHIRQGWVRLYETGPSSPPPKDTGRVYTAVAPSAGYTTLISRTRVLWDTLLMGYVTHPDWQWNSYF